MLEIALRISLFSDYNNLCKRKDITKDEIGFFFKNDKLFNSNENIELFYLISALNNNKIIMNFLFENFNYDIDYNKLFKIACNNNCKDILLLLINNKKTYIDINKYSSIEQNPLIYLIINRNIDLITLILNNFELSHELLLNGFQLACSRNNLDIIQIIIKKNINLNISADSNYAFYEACEKNHYEIAKWFMDKYPEKYYVEIENKLITYHNVIQSLGYFDKESLYLDSECSICYDNSTILTECNHSFCEDCLLKSRKRSINCPNCRQEVDYCYKKARI